MLNSIGLDISKNLIAVHIPINKQDIEVNNNIKGINKLYSKLKKLYKKDFQNIVFVYEPTGNYSFALKKFCSQKLIKCFLINPKQFSNFSKALGERNKTDLVDAQVLSKALSLARDKEVRVPIIDKTIEDIKDLISYYKFITKNTTRVKNHLEAVKVKNSNEYMINDLQKTIKSLKKKELEVLENIKALILSDDELKKSYNNIKSIPGIGDIGGIVLLHLFKKYPQANKKQISSLAGLDPIAKQSGTSINKRVKISKAGSRLYRGTLFLGVLTAIRYDENFKTFFKRLKSNAKHTTAAHIAVMRKMIVIAHSLYKNNTTYEKDFIKNNANQERKCS